MKGVVILAASNYSLYSLMVVEGLAAKGILIDRIVIKKLFNPLRVLTEIKTGPVRFLKKVFTKLIFRHRTSLAASKHSLAGKFAVGGFKAASLTEFSERTSTPISFCNDFHCEEILNKVASSAPRLIVFTGGGIIREPLLKLPSQGVINCHMGILPDYRGMDCYVWAILNDEYKKVGLSTHFMDSGIDTGPIISRFYLNIDEFSDINEIETALEANMPELMVETCVNVMLGECKYEIQHKTDGKQYFVPVKKFRKYANQKIIKSFR